MDLKYLIESDELREQKDKFKRIFFYRICGTGMGGAATLLKESGYDVEGADAEFYPPMSDYLKSSNIKCHHLKDVTDNYLKSFDLIIMGNVVARDSEHAKRVETLQVPFTSFPCAIGALFLADQNVVGIAGTHGKTTTTYFLVQLFRKLGFNPGYLVGGVLPNENSAQMGDGSYFFIESDEYDSAYFHKMSKFHFYYIDHLILTSLEYDHADIYDSLDAIEGEFSRLIPKVSKSFIFNSDYKSAMKLFNANMDKDSDWSFYGENSENGSGPHTKEMIFHEDKSEFSLNLDGKREHFVTNITGKQNILNLTAAIVLAFKQKIPLEKIKEAITSLKMVKRRQEVRGKYKGAIVIDDFAHHPTAVKLTIENVRIRYPDKHMLVVFAPSSATARSSIFQDEFFESLMINNSGADEVILVTPPRTANIKHAGNLDCYLLRDKIKAMGVGVEVVSTLADLINSMDRSVDRVSRVNGRDFVILILSNGSVLGLWESEFVKQLEQLEQVLP
ncbi:MAG: hypothetical protein HQK49_16680 [Oligoflexia bacterium]|nr:hypothetical protein [Oligoflexia bacterium]